MITAVGLLESMEKELRRIFSGMLFHNASGGSEEIRIYKQDIPLQEIRPQADGDPGQDVFPYCVVRAARGEVSENPQKVTLTLEFGLYERDKKNDGEIRILNLIERVSQRFMRDKTLDGKFVLDREVPMKWELMEENTYPYFLGGMEMTWDRPSCVEEEDIYA